MSDRVTLTRFDNGIVQVSLNRPEKRNALDLAMFKAVDETIKNLKRDRSIRAVIVNGNGEDFCSGLDVKSVMSDMTAGMKLLFKWLPGNANLAQRVSTQWRSLPVPVLFAIHGRCWGGGLQIALGGDFRFATPDSSWSIMEAKWGLIPDMGGSLGFKELMPKDKLLELTMTAKKLSGTEALEYNLVTALSDDPLASAINFAETLLNTSPDALAAGKKLVQQTWSAGRRRSLWLESYYQIKVLLGKNQRIAVKRERAEDKSSISYTKRSFK